MIYIAKEYDGTILGIVLARSQDLANVYWQGQDIIPHNVHVLDESNLVNHPTGVIPIVNTEQATIVDYKGDYLHDRRIIKS